MVIPGVRGSTLCIADSFRKRAEKEALNSEVGKQTHNFSSCIILNFGIKLKNKSRATWPSG